MSCFHDVLLWVVTGGSRRRVHLTACNAPDNARGGRESLRGTSGVPQDPAWGRSEDGATRSAAGTKKSQEIRTLSLERVTKPSTRRSRRPPPDRTNVDGLWPTCCCLTHCGISLSHFCRLHRRDRTVDARPGSRMSHGHPLRAAQRDSVADGAEGTRLRIGDDLLATPARLATGRRLESDALRSSELADALRRS